MTNAEANWTASMPCTVRLPCLVITPPHGGPPSPSPPRTSRTCNRTRALDATPVRRALSGGGGGGGGGGGRGVARGHGGVHRDSARTARGVRARGVRGAAVRRGVGTAA